LFFFLVALPMFSKFYLDVNYFDNKILGFQRKLHFSCILSFACHVFVGYDLVFLLSTCRAQEMKETLKKLINYCIYC